MGVGSISSGGSPVLDAALTGQQAATQSAVAMLGTALDVEAQMMASLLQSLQASKPPGLGDAFDSYA